MSDRELELPKDFVYTEEFRQAFELAEFTNENIYITGKAGTGKSTWLMYFLEHTSKSVVVLAPTGIAAINVGGETIHSFFGLPARYIGPNENLYRRNFEFGRSLKTIIIDEISMVRADMIDAIDRFLRQNMYDDGVDGPFGKPFGGVQIIMIGDLYQLSPVVETDLVAHLNKLYTSPYFFSANVWDEAPVKKVEFFHIFRQKDPEFIDFLNHVREGVIGMDDLRFINKRFDPMRAKKEENIVYLVTTNAKASTINQQQLVRLKGEEKTFMAIINGNFDGRSYPTDELLTLKVGAQIVMLRNDPSGRWVNGSIGTVAGFEDYGEVVKTKELGEHTLPGLQVNIDGDVYDVDRASWGKIKYTKSSEEDEGITFNTTGQFIQIPVKLAWAMTMHKSQGQTFDKVIIDFGYGTFAHGQAYVALSRCRTAQGMYLTRPMNKKDIIMDSAVTSYMEGE